MAKTYTIAEMITRNAEAARDGLLNEWETRFASEIEERSDAAKLDRSVKFSLSGRQLACIEKIHDKILKLESDAE